MSLDKADQVPLQPVQEMHFILAALKQTTYCFAAVSRLLCRNLTGTLLSSNSNFCSPLSLFLTLTHLLCTHSRYASTFARAVVHSDK